jgi:hypothetical protein
MLRNARSILKYPAGKRLENPIQHDWLENIKSRYFMQVFLWTKPQTFRRFNSRAL